MYKKIRLKLVLLLSMLFLSSCSIGGSRTSMLNKSSDKENAQRQLEKVLEAIQNRDKDALEALFSVNALNESDEFDSNMDNLFEFFEGEVESFERTSGPSVFESIHYGSKIKKVSSKYHVTTDKQEYFFLLHDFPVDTDHPDNVGLYLLLVVKAEDKDEMWDNYYGKDNELCVGIYLPIQ